ncbi:MAG: PaaI family thioesterase [Alphaproteobacteria bacterium]|nr:PaaI family thioesterase [Alphaproteobacteria bacterium]
MNDAENGGTGRGGQTGPVPWLDAIPHARALGLALRAFGEARAVIALPYDPRLVGNPATGVLHGGAITTLLDTVCGMAAYAALTRLRTMATLDLRIDYMRPATPGATVVGEAACTRVTRRIAFVRGLAHEGDGTDPVAAATATFMLGPDGEAGGP